MKFDVFFQRLKKVTSIHTQKELADVLGVGKAAISLAKRRGVPKHWALKISSIFNINPEWLENGGGPIYLGRNQYSFFVPRVSAKACAGGGSFDVRDTPIEEIPFDYSWIQRKGNPKDMVLMEVIGDSMTPELEEGDTILVDTSQRELQLNQGIYVISLEDSIQIKRIELSRDNAVVLRSTNQSYSPVLLQGDELNTFRIVGRVLWSSREY